MAKGHITLGVTAATAREYVVDIDRYLKVQANPYTAKLSTGGDKYDDLQPWAYHVEQDWQAGVGRKEEEAGGYLFGTAETRVPGQITLPQMVLQSDLTAPTDDGDDFHNLGVRPMNGTITLSSSGASPRKVAIKFGAIATTAPSWVTSFFGYVPNGVSVVIRWLDGASLDTATVLVTHATYTSTDTRPQFKWHTVGSITASATTPEWIEIYPTNGTIELATTAMYAKGDTWTHNGTAWSDAGDYAPIYTTNYNALLTPAGTALLSPTTAIVRFNGTLYAGMGGYLCKYNTATNAWASLGATAASITDLCVFGATLYIGQNGSTVNYWTCSTADAITDSTIANGKFFTAWNGYLYRAGFGAKLWYSADGATWTGPINVGHSDAPITGMAAMGDTVYLATTEALYYLAPGNVVKGITRWGSKRDTNGVSLTHFQGNLYAVVDGGVSQISVNGGQASILPIWVSRDDDLVSAYLAKPIALTVTNNWLVALVQQAASGGRTSLWAWTGQGWHFLAELPLSACNVCYYDQATGGVWSGSNAGVMFKAMVPDYTINPINDENRRFTYSAWIETPWLTGGLVDVTKDWESIYLYSSRAWGGNSKVTIYYQTAESNAWVLVNFLLAPDAELRFSDYVARPATKRIKFGFRLDSYSLTAPPVIEAIRVKFRPNVQDRWQWTLVLPMHTGQQMIDGTINSYTGAQVKAHLETLVKQTPPFILGDVDGASYEVACTGYSLNVAKFEYINATKTLWYMAQVTLEQVYVAP